MSDYCRATEALREGHPEEPPDRTCPDCMEVLNDENARWHFEQEEGYAMEYDEDGCCADNTYCDYCLHKFALDELEDQKRKNKALNEALKNKLNQ